MAGSSVLGESLLPTYLLIDIGALTVIVVILIGIITSVRSGRVDFPLGRGMTMMRKMAEGAASTGGDIVKSFVNVLFVDVTTTRVLRTCRTSKWASHVSIFWGFVFTGIATTLAYFMKPEGTILPLTHPVKIFGNIGGILLIAGCIGMFFVRYQESGSPWHLTRADFFLIVLFLATVAGFILQQAIYTYGRIGTITSASYWIHMITVFALLATSPFSKFIHAIYKPAWILRQRLDTKLPVQIEKSESRTH